jgi:hypothetical protein
MRLGDWGRIVFAFSLTVTQLSEAEDKEDRPCPAALASHSVCEAANQRALEIMKAGNLEATLVMQDVQTGGLVAFAASNPGELDVTTALPPLSPVKLMTAASWLEHNSGKEADREKLLNDSIVNGNDNAGRQIASAVRRAAGTATVLKDLARYGFPARGNEMPKADATFWSELAPRWRTNLVPAASYHSLGNETGTKDWEDTLSIGEERIITTALHLSRFLQAVGNGGQMLMPVARDAESEERPGSTSAVTTVMSESAALKLQEVMRGTVERGTAKSAKLILAETGWTMGGKTGTGPDANSKEPGPGSDGCFAGLVFDPNGKARFTVVTFVKHGGFGGGNAARISAELERFVIGAR